MDYYNLPTGFNFRKPRKRKLDDDLRNIYRDTNPRHMENLKKQREILKEFKRAKDSKKRNK